MGLELAKYEVIHFRVFTTFDINAINEIPNVVIGNRKLKKGRQFNGPKRKKDKHVIHKTLQGKLLPIEITVVTVYFIFSAHF